MKRLLSAILMVILLFSLTACCDEQKTTLQTADLKEMTVGAELPYLLYANNDYCIINMWHGGVIVYDFTTQEIGDRITFEELEKAGFSYPIPSVSEDGKTIYFQEDTMISKEPNTHSYSLERKELDKENDGIEVVIQYENIFENHETQALLSDGFAYGMTFIVLDDTFIVSRLRKGGSLLSDTEIIFMNKSLKPEKTFTLFDE